jgi:hypothetical protein
MPEYVPVGVEKRCNGLSAALLSEAACALVSHALTLNAGAGCV